MIESDMAGNSRESARTDTDANTQIQLQLRTLT
jgi:hypothetical protein